MAVYELPKIVHPDFAFPYRKFTQRPVLDTQSPFVNKNLESVVDLGGDLTDFVSGETWSEESSPSKKATQYGIGRFFTASSSQKVEAGFGIDWTSTEGITMLYHGSFNENSGATTWNTIFGADTSDWDGGALFVQYIHASERFELFFNTGIGGRVNVSYPTASTGRVRALAISYKWGTSTPVICAVDGEIIHDSTASLSAPAATETPAFGGIDNLANRNCDGSGLLGAIWSKSSTRAELIALTRAPYRSLFKPAIPLPYFTAAGGGATVSGALESLSLATFAATIQSDVDTNVSSALESLSLTTNVATVDAGVDTDINASIASITLTTSQASIQADVDTDINAALESLGLTTFGAAISADQSISGTLESLVISALQAAVTTGSAISAQTEAITLSTFLSTITADTAISGNVESIEVSTNPASVTLGSAIAAGLESLTIQTSGATVTAGTSISGALESVVLTELAAQISIGQNIDAQLESLTLTTSGATIVLDTGITATLESLTLQTFAASLTIPTTNITAPGLQYTLPVNRLHFSFED